MPLKSKSISICTRLYGIRVIFKHLFEHRTLTSTTTPGQSGSKPSRLGLQNTPTASLQSGKNPLPASVLDMTLTKLMVRLK